MLWYSGLSEYLCILAKRPEIRIYISFTFSIFIELYYISVHRWMVALISEIWWWKIRLLTIFASWHWLFFVFEREREHKLGEEERVRKREGGKESQADSMLSAELRLHLTTLRSWPESKPKVRCLTQAPERNKLKQAPFPAQEPHEGLDLIILRSDHDQSPNQIRHLTNWTTQVPCLLTF